MAGTRKAAKEVILEDEAVTDEPVAVDSSVEEDTVNYPGIDKQICARCGYFEKSMFTRCRVCANNRS